MTRHALARAVAPGLGAFHGDGETVEMRDARGLAPADDAEATVPAFRGRGAQRALLSHRLRMADRAGLARVHTCTGSPAPGDPQHSYGNTLRCGFAETAQRRNLAPAARVSGD